MLGPQEKVGVGVGEAVALGQPNPGLQLEVVLLDRDTEAVRERVEDLLRVAVRERVEERDLVRDRVALTTEEGRGTTVMAARVGNGGSVTAMLVAGTAIAATAASTEGSVAEATRGMASGCRLVGGWGGGGETSNHRAVAGWWLVSFWVAKRPRAANPSERGSEKQPPHARARHCTGAVCYGSARPTTGEWRS